MIMQRTAVSAQGNLVHAGRYCKEHLHRRITRRYLERQFEVVEVCREWLADHNAKSLMAHIREEEAAKES